MSYQPIIPSIGLAGWGYLQRTYDAQVENFNAGTLQKRNAEYFAENIKKVGSAAELVKDHRLLSVALGAFGLQDDLANKYFIQRILEDGTESDDALANRLVDQRYRDLSDAFGFGPGAVRATSNSEKMAGILAMSRVQAFEVAVGEQDESMRIALTAERELQSLAVGTESDDAKWFSLMAMPPLRKMLETALGLPSSFGRIDIDQQMKVFREKTGSVTGRTVVAQFADQDIREKMIRLFLVRSQISETSGNNRPAARALAILGGS